MDASFLTLPDRRLAYQLDLSTDPQKIPLMFLGGYATDMNGTKACFLSQKCREEGRSLLRFDYAGQGASSGAFLEGTIGGWFDDALAVFDALGGEKRLLIGSSMGGWIGLLLALARPSKVAGFIGIAAAPDFTEELVLPILSEAQKKQLKEEGLTYEEGVPEEARVPMTAKLLEEGKKHLILGGPISLSVPVRLLQGMRDRDVPWKFALRLAEKIEGDDVQISFVKGADHRLSRPQDLELLWQTVQAFG